MIRTAFSFVGIIADPPAARRARIQALKPICLTPAFGRLLKFKQRHDPFTLVRVRHIGVDPSSGCSMKAFGS